MKIIIKLAELIVFAALIIGIILGIIVLSEKLILPKDYYFYQYHPVSEKFMIYPIVIPAVIVIGAMRRRLCRKNGKGLENMYDLFWGCGRFPIGKLILSTAWIISLYACLSTATVVTKDKIICHSPLHPSGVVYSYRDVSRIHTGFGQKRFAFLEYQKKGNFYYQIELSGEQIVFSVPNVNGEIKRYADETYLELEEFDRKLVAYDTPKQSDEKGWEDCELDGEYVERFRRIIALR